METDIEPRLRVNGDPELLTQLVVNLIENALRHAPEHSRIRVGLAASAGDAELTIADDGPGIPAGQRERVLRRFVRLESSRTNPGTGLGLSLVAAIARLHGASLVLGDAEPGLRATVRVALARQGKGTIADARPTR